MSSSRVLSLRGPLFLDGGIMSNYLCMASLCSPSHLFRGTEHRSAAIACRTTVLEPHLGQVIAIGSTRRIRRVDRPHKGAQRRNIIQYVPEHILSTSTLVQVGLFMLGLPPAATRVTVGLITASCDYWIDVLVATESMAIVARVGMCPFHRP
jgi:hypothetical protein